MDTDDLIDTLVARHRAVDTVWIERAAVVVALAGVLCAAALIWPTLRFRTDLVSAMSTGRIAAKYAFMLAALVFSGAIFIRLARPGRRLKGQIIIYCVPLVFILASALIELAISGLPDRATMLGNGANWISCVVFVPVLAIPAFVGLLWILRTSAPTDLRGAGFAAGVFAATIAAMAYAAHCPCDTPVFVAVWYPLAFALGGYLGSRIAPIYARW